MLRKLKLWQKNSFLTKRKKRVMCFDSGQCTTSGLILGGV